MSKNISRPIIYCIIAILFLGGIYAAFDPSILAEYLTLIIIAIPVAIIVAVSDQLSSKKSAMEKAKFELLPNDVQQQMITKQRRKLLLTIAFLVIVMIVFANISSKL